KFISREDYIEATKKNKPEKGDVLVTRIGSIGISKVVDWDYEFSIYVTLAVIKKSDQFIPQYLASYIQSSRFQKEILRRSLLKAAPQKINMNELRECEVLLPPDEEKKEQQKIASCLSSLDELLAAHKDKLDALKDHKKGLLQNLFPQEGETVPKVRFPEFEGDGEWVEKELDEVTSYVDYRGKTPKKSEDGVFLVTAKNIREGYIDYELSKEYIPVKTYEDVMRRGKPKIGDVLITTEAPLGNVAKVDREDIALAQRVIKFRGKANILDNAFLNQTFLSTYFQSKLERNSSGSTAKGIKGSVLRKLSISIPINQKEQQKIASCLSAVDELITAQQEKIEQLQQHKKGLMQGLFPKMTD